MHITGNKIHMVLFITFSCMAEMCIIDMRGLLFCLARWSKHKGACLKLIMNWHNSFVFPFGYSNFHFKKRCGDLNSLTYKSVYICFVIHSTWWFIYSFGILNKTLRESILLFYVWKILNIKLLLRSSISGVILLALSSALRHLNTEIEIFS